MSTERKIVAVCCLAIIGACAGVTIAAAVARMLGIAMLVPALAGTVGGATAACALTRRLARQLPDELDGWFARRRIVRWLWAFAAVLAVGNTARICLFVAEPTQVWASAFPPVPDVARHQCLAMVAICWVLLQGSPPIGSTSDDVIASLPSQIASIAIAVMAAWPRRRVSAASSPAPGATVPASPP